jgi:outer membrane protein OmpA-like peptidoglycan-associated protein
MKTLIIGSIVFLAWSAFSIHIYVCNIRGLCDEPMTSKINLVDQKSVNINDTLNKPQVQKQAIIPENLVTYFAFDKSDFNADAHSNKYFDDSNTFLSQNPKAMFSITGYTDAVGTDDYNLALGYRRAQSVQHYFESKGVPVNKIILDSKGEKDPADDNNTSAGRANNRRTVLTIKK